MGSFDNVKRLLNEVTYNPEKSIARDKKLAAAHKDKVTKGMKDVMGLETPRSTEKRRSQLLKVGSKAHAKAKSRLPDHTELLDTLQALKESYEKKEISEEVFIKLAQPLIHSVSEGSLGYKRGERIHKSAMKASTKVNGPGPAFDKYEKMVDVDYENAKKLGAKFRHRRKIHTGKK